MKELNKGLFAKKIGMTKIFTETGEAIPVTVLEACENVVIQKKDKKTDGYNSLKLGYREVKESKMNKAEMGQMKDKYFKKSAEVRLKDDSKYNVGDALTVSIFEEKEKVSVTGISKGRGFTGTVKRHNFRISPISHGSKSHRRQGSIGAGTGQGKVWRGQKMPGQFGAEQITTKNLKVIRVIAEKGLLLVQGGVPGANKGIVKIYN
ncbi:MAG: 50S ribosomal protein L3 [Candidatus Margulisbacteria bacterium GWF2_35_9]|nr:ribosomal protein L3 [uncultured bacterium]OGI05898.1 MAG: 50S ribosomal protein L3 [Candidatus Margulisbacteria bacterium GWF2_35_9]